MGKPIEEAHPLRFIKSAGKLDDFSERKFP